MVNIALNPIAKVYHFFIHRAFFLTLPLPFITNKKSSPSKHLNTAEYQRSSFLKKLRKLAVGAKKS